MELEQPFPYLLYNRNRKSLADYAYREIKNESRDNKISVCYGEQQYIFPLQATMSPRGSSEQTNKLEANKGKV